MKIATWNIGSGININNYTCNLFDIAPSADVDDQCMNIIANQIKEQDIDVIALQEVITTSSFKYMKSLSALTGLKYYEQFENSPCHLVKDSKFGIAILSRYPIEVIEKQLFPNPGLIKKTQTGSYSTHDKGYMIVKIKAEKDFYVSTTQFLPFHRFNADILDYKEYFKQYCDQSNKYDVICCGDYNVVQGKEKLGMLLNDIYKTHTFLFDEVTTLDNKKCDNIFVPFNIKIKNKYFIHNDLSSDHFMCVAEI